MLAAHSTTHVFITVYLKQYTNVVIKILLSNINKTNLHNKSGYI